MRIIENNYVEVPPQPEYEIVCPHCKSKLVYETYDVCSCGDDKWIYCEACGREIKISEDDKLPTAETLQYPQDFYSFVNGVSINDKEINKWIKECINDLDKTVDYAARSSGDTLVFACKCDEASHLAEVVVAKKYQVTEVEIPEHKY